MFFFTDVTVYAVSKPTLHGKRTVPIRDGTLELEWLVITVLAKSQELFSLINVRQSENLIS